MPPIKVGFISLSGLLAGLILCIYFQALYFDFISFDDSVLVVDNLNITNGLSFGFLNWAFTTYTGGNWNPLVWISYAIDYQAFGNSPHGYHAVNICLHIVNSLLLFKLMFVATGEMNRSFLVAIIFAIHPQHVEVVTWISARKDLLSSLFGFLAIHSYLVAKEQRGALFKTAIYMALSLMAKPMFVTLPFLLILLDIWPLSRLKDGVVLSVKLRELFAEKWLLFLLTICGCVVSYLSHSSSETISSLGFLDTVSNVVNAYVFYIIKFLYPVNLSIFYPFQIPGLYESLFYLLLLFLVSYIAFMKMRTVPYLFVGWFWYVGMLFPVSGIIQFGGHSFADRFSYVPQIGLVILLVWCVSALVEKLKLGKPIVIGVSLLLLVGLSLLSFVQAGYWKNSYTLFKHTENIVGDNAFVYAKVSEAYSSDKKYEKAVMYNIKALDAQQDQSHVIEGLTLHLIRDNGLLLYKLGELESSLFYLQQANSNNPEDKESLQIMIMVLHELGRYDEERDAIKMLKNR